MDIDYRKFFDYSLPIILDNKLHYTDEYIIISIIRNNTFNAIRSRKYAKHIQKANDYIKQATLPILFKYYCLFKSTTVYQSLVDDVSRYIFMLSISK
jgi:hypothetical protein